MFREAEFRAYCAVCEGPGEQACQRCKRAYCQSHAPLKESHCGVCEADFYREPGRLSDAGGQAKMLAELTVGVSVPLVAAFAAIGMAPLAIGFAIGGGVLMSGLGIKALWHKRERKKYLAQGRKPKRLTDGGPPKDANMDAPKGSETDASKSGS